jgi:threonine synthase
VTVSDQAILAAIGEVARGAGVFAEPAAAAAYAGLKEAVRRRLVDPDWRIVVLITGNGLKDVAAAMKTAGEPRLIPPDPAMLETLFPNG